MCARNLVADTSSQSSQVSHAISGHNDLQIVLEDAPGLISMSKALKALAEANSIEDVKAIRDQAEAARVYARSALLGLEVQNQAAEIKLRAERKVGSILAAAGLQGGDRRSKSQKATLKVCFPGISKHQSSRWQLASLMPENEFAGYVQRCVRESRELTTAGVLRWARMALGRHAASKPILDPSLAEVAAQLRALAKNNCRFRCILAFPPWDAQEPEQPTKKRKQANHSIKDNFRELTALPLGEISAENSHLHLWAPEDRLFDAKRLVEAWGFRCRNTLVVLRAPDHFGDHWRAAHDYLLLGAKGTLSFKDNGKSSWVDLNGLNMSGFSRELACLIEQVSAGPYLRIFGDGSQTGWTVVRALE